MAIYHKISRKNISVCIFENRYSVEELLAFFNNSEIYKKEIEEFTYEKRKKEYLGLRVALKECYDNGENYKIIYDKDGKPSLENSEKFISFSHACIWNVSACSNKKVGVDIEIPSEKLRRVSSKFLSEEEIKDFSPKTADLETLCLLWSSKEVLYKIIGHDTVDFAAQLRIFPFEKKQTGEIRAEHISKKRIYTLFYEIDERFIIVFGTEE